MEEYPNQRGTTQAAQPDPGRTRGDRIIGSGFSIVPHWLLESPASDKAIRTYLVLQSYVNGTGGGRAWPSRRTLAGQLGCSVDTVDRAVRELVQQGALAVEHRFRPGEVTMQTSNSYYLVGDDPKVTALARPPGRIHAAPPGRVDAVPETDPVLETDPVNKPLAALPLDVPEPGSDADPSFVAFWSSYPRKVDKGGARKAWRAAIKKAAPDTIVEGAQRFARDPNLPPPTYIAHPSTWLNGERWADGPLPSRTGGTARSQSTSNSEAILRRIGEQREARG